MTQLEKIHKALMRGGKIHGINAESYGIYTLSLPKRMSELNRKVYGEGILVKEPYWYNDEIRLIRYSVKPKHRPTAKKRFAAWRKR